MTRYLRIFAKMLIDTQSGFWIKVKARSSSLAGVRSYVRSSLFSKKPKSHRCSFQNPDLAIKWGIFDINCGRLSTGLLTLFILQLLPRRSCPHFLTVPSISLLTITITINTAHPITVSTIPHPFRFELPNIPAFIAYPKIPLVVTSSSPFSNPFILAAATSSGVCPPSLSSNFWVMAGFVRFSFS